jgi:hypothetical protein
MRSPYQKPNWTAGRWALAVMLVGAGRVALPPSPATATAPDPASGPTAVPVGERQASSAAVGDRRPTARGCSSTTTSDLGGEEQRECSDHAIQHSEVVRPTP